MSITLPPFPVTDDRRGVSSLGIRCINQGLARLKTWQRTHAAAIYRVAANGTASSSRFCSLDQWAKTKGKGPSLFFVEKIAIGVLP